MAIYLERPIAHRGLHDDLIPENSMLAFERAQEAGFSIELDVRITKDGIPVVFHDKDLRRMTGASGLVEQYTLKSLKKLKLLNTSHTIPTYEEVLECLSDETIIITEVKNEGHDNLINEEIAKIIDKRDKKVCVQSFNVFTLKWYRENYNFLPLGLLTTDKFGDFKLSFLKKQMVRSMLLAPVVRPDYVGLNHESFSTYQLNFVSQLTNAHMLFWTIRSKADYQKIKNVADNIIFEGFNPYE